MRSALLALLLFASSTYSADKPVVLNGHTGWVGAVAFSPDGKLLASASADNTIRIWSVADGSLLTTLKGHADYACAVTFSPDGKRIASGSFDHAGKLWDVSTGAELATLKGHEGVVLS